MLEAEPFLGLDIASTSPAFLAFLACHVVAAIVAIVGGLMAMLARKGSVRHRAAGRTYLIAVWIVFLTACVMAAFRWIDDYPLIVTGAVAAGSATFGFLYRRLHRPGDAPHIVAMSLSYVAMLTAFYVDNGPHLPIWNLLPPIAFWFLPAIVGLPLTIRAIRRARRRAAQGLPGRSTVGQ